MPTPIKNVSKIAKKKQLSIQTEQVTDAARKAKRHKYTVMEVADFVFDLAYNLFTPDAIVRLVNLTFPRKRKCELSDLTDEKTGRYTLDYELGKMEAHMEWYQKDVKGGRNGQFWLKRLDSELVAKILEADLVARTPQPEMQMVTAADLWKEFDELVKERDAAQKEATQEIVGDATVH